MLNPEIKVDMDAQRIYKLKASAPKVGISIEELYSDYETARHEFETWKYDSQVMEAHGNVSLVEMTTSSLFPKPYKFEVTRNLGQQQW